MLIDWIFDGRKALVRPVEADYYTDAISYTDVKVLEILSSRKLKNFCIHMVRFN